MKGENVIQCSVHGRLPRPFENVFSLLYRIPTDARSVLCFRGPGGCLRAAFKSTSVCLHAALKQMLGPRHKSHAAFHLRHSTVLCHKCCCSELEGPKWGVGRWPAAYFKRDALPMKVAVMPRGDETHRGIAWRHRWIFCVKPREREWAAACHFCQISSNSKVYSVPRFLKCCKHKKKWFTLFVFSTDCLKWLREILECHVVTNGVF